MVAIGGNVITSSLMKLVTQIMMIFIELLEAYPSSVSKLWFQKNLLESFPLKLKEEQQNRKELLELKVLNLLIAQVTSYQVKDRKVLQFIHGCFEEEVNSNDEEEEEEEGIRLDEEERKLQTKLHERLFQNLAKSINTAEEIAQILSLFHGLLSKMKDTSASSARGDQSLLKNLATCLHEILKLQLVHHDRTTTQENSGKKLAESLSLISSILLAMSKVGIYEPHHSQYINLLREFLIRIPSGHEDRHPEEVRSQYTILESGFLDDMQGLFKLLVATAASSSEETASYNQKVTVAILEGLIDLLMYFPLSLLYQIAPVLSGSPISEICTRNLLFVMDYR